MISKDSIIIESRILRTHACMKPLSKYSQGQRLISAYANWALDELTAYLYSTTADAELVLESHLDKLCKFAEFFETTHKDTNIINPFMVAHDTILQIYRSLSDEDIPVFGFGYDKYIM